MIPITCGLYLSGLISASITNRKTNALFFRFEISIFVIYSLDVMLKICCL